MVVAVTVCKEPPLGSPLCKLREELLEQRNESSPTHHEATSKKYAAHA